MPLSKNELHSFIKDNSLVNEVVCIHSSFKSLGGFDGDVSEFCDIFLSHGCTLLVPSHSWQFFNDYPLNFTPTIQSKWDYSEIQSAGFNPSSNVVDPDKGIITNYLLTVEGRLRSNNPLGSFVAVGPKAEELLKETSSYHGQFKTFTELNGKILMIGLDSAKMTYIHYIKELCGLSLVYRWVKDSDDKDRWVLGGGCSTNFGRLAPLIESLTKPLTLGDSKIQLFNATDVKSRLMDHFNSEGDSTACEPGTCSNCDDNFKEIEIIDEELYYQVLPTDTLWELSQKFNTPPQHLLSMCKENFFTVGVRFKYDDMKNVEGYYCVQPGETIETVMENSGMSREKILEQCENGVLFASQWLNL